MTFPTRSLLFVPGNKPNMINKALSFQPDVFIPDMEDSVPDSERVPARAVVADRLKGRSSIHKAVLSLAEKALEREEFGWVKDLKTPKPGGTEQEEA